MADTVSFADNLGITSGSGLVAFARVGFWYYARHDSGTCQPGLWFVQLHGGAHMGEFHTMCTEAHCVVDDFGNLVSVQ